MTDPQLPSAYSQPASHILHPTDFSEDSNVALGHALRLALTNKAELHLLHVGKDTKQEWHEFPSIREFLQRWGIIEPGASRSEVTDLGIDIEKVIDENPSVPLAVENFCQRRPIDMIVLASGVRSGLSAWLKPSQATQIAERVSSLTIPTLFVPARTRGCVDVDSGEVSMKQVLVPVDHEPDSGAAIERGLRAISLFGGQDSKLTLMHVGAKSKFPNIEIPDGPWQVERVARQGSPAAEIVAVAEEIQANAIVMVTAGTEGFLDVLRGTTTSQVLQQAPCPLLAIPAPLF